MLLSLLASVLLTVSPTEAKGTILVPDFEETPIAEATHLFDARVAAGDHVVLFKIDSHGGDVELGQDFIHHIREVKNATGVHVLCLVSWKAYSMGFLFLQGACDERYAEQDAVLMAHGVATGAQGKADNIASAAAAMEALNDSGAAWCAKRMGITKAAYRAHTDHTDWWMSADKALELHAIDGILYGVDVPPPFKAGGTDAP
jgi:ATP-dependent protease ClpP protease subunit